MGHQSLRNKDHFLGDSAAMTVEFRLFVCFSDLKYGEAIGDSVCAFGFRKTFSDNQLIIFWQSVRSVMDCIEQLSTLQLFHCFMLSLFLVK